MFRRPIFTLIRKRTGSGDSQVFFIGDPIHCPENPYFSEHDTEKSKTFEEFVELFDNAVRGEYFDEQEGMIFLTGVVFYCLGSCIHNDN